MAACGRQTEQNVTQKKASRMPEEKLVQNRRTCPDFTEDNSFTGNKPEMPASTDRYMCAIIV